MTVGQLIERLGEFDASLPVCLADWNEDWALPSESAAQIVEEIANGRYNSVDESDAEGKFVCIGGLL